jgi:hypothetical protein
VEMTMNAMMPGRSGSWQTSQRAVKRQYLLMNTMINVSCFHFDSLV